MVGKRGSGVNLSVWTQDVLFWVYGHFGLAKPGAIERRKCLELLKDADICLELYDAFEFDHSGLSCTSWIKITDPSKNVPGWVKDLAPG